MERAASGPSIPASKHTPDSPTATPTEDYEQTEEQVRETQLLVELLPRSLRDSLLSRPDISQARHFHGITRGGAFAEGVFCCSVLILRLSSCPKNKFMSGGLGKEAPSLLTQLTVAASHLQRLADRADKRSHGRETRC